MTIALISGSAGLIGSEASRFFSQKGMAIVGIDNDMRRFFFGEEASTIWNRQRLQADLPNYTHIDADIRNQAAMEKIFATYNNAIAVVIHTAAQPSHDWAARDPITDFTVNANGTLNLLEMTRRYAPKAVFIFTSTNKVYGDTPNHLPLVEQKTRWEIEPSHPFFQHGIDESLSLDHTTHSLFGVSKTAADLMVQEYGRYFGMYTGCFRGGCLTGPAHSGAELHGFLAYLMKCTLEGRPYTVFGYKAKQVRDNIHSHDLVNMLWHFYQNPRIGEVYNAGGSRHSHCSMLEAIDLCQELTGKKLVWSYSDKNRVGDHIWYVSNVQKFQKHYPDWNYHYNLRAILSEMRDGIPHMQQP